MKHREVRVCFIGLAVWKNEMFSNMFNSSRGQASSCLGPLSKGLDWRETYRIKPMLYAIALFIHIVGALGIFVCISLESASLFGLRRAKLMEEVRAWASLHLVIAWAFPLAVLLTLGAGLFLSLDTWGWKVPWIDVAFFAFMAMGLLGRLNVRRHQQLHRSMGEALSGPLPAELLPLLHDAVLCSSPLLLAAIGLGVVFLMTVKPDLLGSLIALSIAILVGLFASVMLRGIRQTRRDARQHTHA